MNALTPEDLARLVVYLEAALFGVFVTGLIGLVREVRRQRVERARLRTMEDQRRLAALARRMGANPF